MLDSMERQGKDFKTRQKIEFSLEKWKHKNKVK